FTPAARRWGRADVSNRQRAWSKNAPCRKSARGSMLAHFAPKGLPPAACLAGTGDTERCKGQDLKSLGVDGLTATGTATIGAFIDAPERRLNLGQALVQLLDLEHCSLTFDNSRITLAHSVVDFVFV